ncbi:MAG: hypothetical protein ACKODH_02410 [Limisphaerales bacterium]
MTVELLIERVVAVGLLVIGLSHWLRARMWADLFDQWRKARGFGLYLGWFYSQVGSVVALGHNVWAWDAVVVVTLLGWMWTFKGILFLLWPNLLERVVDKSLAPDRNPERKFARVGASMAVVGAVLVWRVFVK